MKTKKNVYKVLSLIMICLNTIVFFTLFYILLEVWKLGTIIEHFGNDQDQFNWIDRITKTLYFSAITLFSVGYGDITPVGWARMVAILEAAVGYILPVVITVQYLKLFPIPLNKLFKGNLFTGEDKTKKN